MDNLLLRMFAFSLHLVASTAVPLGQKLTTTTFSTEPISVNTSGIAFINVPIEVPKGPFALHSLSADLVDDKNDSVPLSEAYFHHWFISVLRANSTSSEPPVEVAHFGAGSEIRHAPETFPAGTAAYFEGNEDWVAQVHLIDLRSTHPEDRLPCIECRRHLSCEDGACLRPEMWFLSHGMYHNYAGGIYACNWGEMSPDRKIPETAGSAFCTKRRAKGEERTYRLQYKMVYSMVEGPPQEQPWVSLHGAVLKAEAPYAEYNVPACLNQSANPMCVHRKVSDWVFSGGVFNCTSCPPFDHNVAPGKPAMSHLPTPFINAGLVWATGHQHDGAMGLELWLTPPNASEPELLFESVPSYGSEEGVPGNELGFLVAHTIKTWENPVPIQEGAKLRVVSKYDAHPPAYDLTGFKAGREIARTGVMGYMIIRVVDLDGMAHGVSTTHQA